MTGYRRKVYKLVFDDENLAGLEVRARGVSVERAVEMLALGSALAGGDVLKDTDEGKALRERMYAGVASVLLSWNYEEDDGTPIPCNTAGIRTADLAELLAIFEAWSSAVMGVGRPLAPSSNGGDPSVEQALSMLPAEPLSPSPPP